MNLKYTIYTFQFTIALIISFLCGIIPSLCFTAGCVFMVIANYYQNIVLIEDIFNKVTHIIQDAIKEIVIEDIRNRNIQAHEKDKDKV